MRRRLAEAKPGAGRWDVKAGPGRLQEIELIAQTAALMAGSTARRPEAQLAAGQRAGWPSKADVTELLAAYRLCWRVHCAARLLSDAPADPDRLGPGATGFLLRETGTPDLPALAERIDQLCTAAATIADSLLPQPEPGAEPEAQDARTPEASAKAPPKAQRTSPRATQR